MRPTHSACIWLVLGATLALAQNPVPFVNQPLVPDATSPGGSSFTLTVNGTGFVSASTVNWNGSPLTTTFVTNSQLTAEVPASNIVAAGTASVTVVSPPPGGGVSNVEFFGISAPASNVTFTQAATYPVGSGDTSPPFPIAADFNGDGKLDLAYFVGTTTNNVIVQLGNGDGTFQAPVAYSTGSVPCYMVAADFNGDGKLDLAVSSATDNTVSVLLGNGDGTFQPQTSFATGSGPYSIVTADFNGDGNLDLAVGLHGGGFSILLGNGDGTFQTHVDYATSGPCNIGMTAGDFNGDGRLDLIYFNCIENSDLEIAFLEGNGDGTFQAPVLSSWPLMQGAVWAALTADLNGDGKLDLMTADVGDSPSGGGAWVLLGNGDGTFQSPVGYSIPNSYWQLALQDFNADDKLDAAFASSDATFANSGANGGAFSVLLGNGDGTFQSPIDFPTSYAAYVVAAGDFNGDGKMDSVVSVQSTALPFTSDLVVFLQGQFPVASPSPSSLTFPQQAMGTTSQAQGVTLTNTGTVTLTLSGIAITGANASDFGENNSCGTTLAPNASCPLNVTFTPTANGTRTAALSISSNGVGSPQTVSLTGTTPPYLSPSTVTFPNQYVGTTGLPQTVTLINTGTTAITITNVTASPSDFAPVSACGSSVAAGTSCSIGVFFDPTTTGTRNGLLTVTDSATGSPQTVTLSGTGQDFSVAPSSSSSATVTAGQTASYTVSVAPEGGFNQTVTLSCSGAPVQSACSLSSSSVKLTGSSAASVTVTVTTAGTSASLAPPAGSPLGGELALWFALSGLSGLVVVCSSRSRSRIRRNRLLYGFAFLCLFSLGITWSACGSGSANSQGSSGTPTGTYNLTVTGSFTSGSTNLNHSTKLTLVVQ